MADRTWIAFPSDHLTLSYLRSRGIHPRHLAETAFETRVRQLQVQDALEAVA